MKLERHPEYTQYLQDRETLLRCRRVVHAWVAEGTPIEVREYGLTWTPASARSFLRSLQRLFRAYNRVLWEQFPYCQACGGGCCVYEASHVGILDGLALALLDLDLPDLPPDLPVSKRACIYLAGRACALPAGWRTVKCWSFFCLGGHWDPAMPMGESYRALTTALKKALGDHLPGELRRYEQVRADLLADHLHDPAEFVAALDDALLETLVMPLRARYPLLLDGPEGPHASTDEDSRLGELLSFVTEAIQEILTDPPPAPKGLQVTPEQLLEDLETLEWIVVGRPTHRARLLREMQARYAGAPGPANGERPSVWYRMDACVRRVAAHPQDRRHGGSLTL